MQTMLRDPGLTAPSAYLPAPANIEAWKKAVESMAAYGFEYLVIGDNPILDAEGWIRRADVLSQFGKTVRDAGMKFCYHAHYNEFARLGTTTGYEILLKRCDAKLLNMEMDIFWATYAGADPLSYWRRFPGDFHFCTSRISTRTFPSIRTKVLPQTDRIPLPRWDRETSIGRGCSPTHPKRV